MSSMRKPKRVTMRGDNEREYMFLIKGGEDLRQDQRIEQVRGEEEGNDTTLLALITRCSENIHPVRTIIIDLNIVRNDRESTIRSIENSVFCCLRRSFNYIIFQPLSHSVRA